MTTDNLIQRINHLVDTVLEPEPEYFRVNVKIKPTNNVKVYLDGDNGISIEKCVQFNRKLYKLIEESDFFEQEDFSLEVSSAGTDEPLLLKRQYIKNTGRFIKVIFLDGTEKEGKLTGTNEEDIFLEETSGKGKKAVTQQIIIPFNNIKTVTVQVKF